jgi:hypothetical protein
MKKITLILLLLIGFSGVESLKAQNQNYLPEFVQRVPQQKYVEAFKNQTGISDEDLPTNAYKIWVNAWFGKVSSQNGVITISPVSWEWNDGHFFKSGSWVQGNSNMPYPAESKILNALNDLQMRAEQILGSPLPPLEGEFPNRYVERILNYLPIGVSSVASKPQGKPF